MDEIVARAMQKWPNVPNVFGWLRLDPRGNWWIRSGRANARPTGEAEPVFERISNPAVIEFIGRNYQADERGRWFFQNGPQRVFVTLEAAPLVYRLRGGAAAGGSAAFEAHTGAGARELRGAWLDESGRLLVETELGPGVVLDRDLQAVERCIEDDTGAPLSEAAFDALAAGAPEAPGAFLALGAARVPIGRLASAELARRFGFDADPRPAPGEPEC